MLKIRIVILIFLLPLYSFCQLHYKEISKYYLIELSYSQEPYKINVLRLALVPKDQGSLNVNVLKSELKQKNDISTLSLSADFFVYNFLPAFPDSYSYLRPQSSDEDSQGSTDTSATTKIYFQYLESLAKGGRLAVTDDVTLLRNDSMLLKVTQVSGKIFVVDYKTGRDIASRNRRIRENYKTKGISLPSGTSEADMTNQDKEFCISDVFMDFPGKFVLQGGENKVDTLMSGLIKNRKLKYRNKKFVIRAKLPKR